MNNTSNDQIDAKLNEVFIDIKISLTDMRYILQLEDFNAGIIPN